MIKKLLLALALLLLPSLAEATDRYASPSGVGSAPCTTIGSPCSLATAIPLTVAGDTLNIRAGTYTTRFDSGVLTINSGTSFANAPRFFSYDGIGAAIIQPTGNSAAVVFNDAQANHHIIFDGLIFDCTNVTGSAQSCIGVGSATGDPAPVHHIRFINTETRNTGAAASNPDGITGAGFLVGGSDNEFTNCSSHHNGFGSTTVGDDAAYGFYITGKRNVIDNCAIDHNGAYGVHISHTDVPVTNATDDNVVKNSRVYENGWASTHQVAGILLTSGHRNQAFNNEVWTTVNNNPGNIGISLGTDFSSCFDCVAYFNTVVGMGLYGIEAPTPSTGAIVRNNIVHNNVTNLFNTGSGSTFSNNLCTTSCGVGTSNQTEAASATFTNVATQNFTLKATSLAIGNAISAGGITTDIFGTTRPQGTLPDIGARELAATPTCPSLPNALIAQYRFEGVSTDSSGNGLTASLGAGWTYTSGKYGQGVTSDGTSGITVASNALLDFCNGFTLELHVNLPSILTDTMLIVKNPNSKYFIGTLNGFCDPAQSLMGGFSQVSLVAACTSPLLTTGIFNHLAVSYDGTTVSLYRNGSLVATAAGGAVLDATTGTLQICTSGFGETCPPGTIVDEVKIYRGPRTGPQILTDMMDGATPAAVVLKIPSSATGLKLGGAGTKLGTQSP